MLQALANDPAFTRIAKGVYTLSALASPNGRYAVTERKPAAAKGPRAPKKDKDVAFQPVQSSEVLWLDYVLGMNNGFDYDHSITVRAEVAYEGTDINAGYLFNGFQVGRHVAYALHVVTVAFTSCRDVLVGRNGVKKQTCWTFWTSCKFY